MVEVKLIFDNKKIYVDKSILMNFEYFRNLFEIQDNNIKVDNINYDLFKILILMYQNDKDINKELAILADYLNSDKICNSLIDFKCTRNGCEKIATNKKFCEIHTCKAIDCDRGDENKYDYCIIHRCKFYDCNEFAISKYCANHKCSIVNCQHAIYFNFKVCANHKCIMYDCGNKTVTESYYCENHKCKVTTCVTGALDIYCEKHICSYLGGCKNERLKGSKYCVAHKCIIKNCNSPCALSCTIHECYKYKCPKDCTYNCLGCRSHTCCQYTCTNLRMTDSKFCEEHSEPKN